MGEARAGPLWQLSWKVFVTYCRITKCSSALLLLGSLPKNLSVLITLDLQPKWKYTRDSQSLNNFHSSIFRSSIFRSCPNRHQNFEIAPLCFYFNSFKKSVNTLSHIFSIDSRKGPTVSGLFSLTKTWCAWHIYNMPVWNDNIRSCLEPINSISELGCQQSMQDNLMWYMYMFGQQSLENSSDFFLFLFDWF